MGNHLNFFIDGKWVAPVVPATLDVIDPSTEEAYTKISVGSKADAPWRRPRRPFRPRRCRANPKLFGGFADRDQAPLDLLEMQAHRCGRAAEVALGYRFDDPFMVAEAVMVCRRAGAL
jgi:hypothetical protein